VIELDPHEPRNKDTANTISIANGAVILFFIASSPMNHVKIVDVPRTAQGKRGAEKQSFS
jgi:hypothetical protein